MEAFKGFCQKFRVEPETKKNRYAILQAEDELAAIGMVIGARGPAPARSRRPSGPGISLMNEFIGLAYYAEVPAVIFDVQRTGPSTGMPTRTQQGDLMLCAYASHGDTRHICLYPADPREAFELAVQAFDLAERFQTPVFVLSDLDIGMNDWMVPKLTWDDAYRPDRGKVLSAEELDEAKTLLPLPRRRRRRHPAPHACPACTPRAPTSPAARATTSSAAYTEDADEYRKCSTASTARSSAPPAAVPAPVVQDVARRQDGAGHRRRLPRRLHGGARPAGQGRHRPRLHAGARVPVRRRGARASSSRTTSTSSSSRTATGSCAAC